MSTSKRSTDGTHRSRIGVHVTPKSARDEVAGWRGDELRLRVRAAPEKGKANEAACVLVAQSLALSKRSVSVVSGHASRHKILQIAGACDAEVHAVFGAPPGP